MTITFTTAFPSINSCTLLSAKATFSNSSLVISFATVTFARTLPKTCTTTSISSSTSFDSSNVGHVAYVIVSSCPKIDQSSSAICGAIGD